MATLNSGVDVTNAQKFILSLSISLLDVAYGQENNSTSPLFSAFSFKGVTYTRSAREQDDVGVKLGR
jgi:hypothetical protein